LVRELGLMRPTPPHPKPGAPRRATVLKRCDARASEWSFWDGHEAGEGAVYDGPSQLPLDLVDPDERGLAVPWINRSDVYGYAASPSDLAYMTLDGPESLTPSFAWAKATLMCRGCIAAARFDPWRLNTETLGRYIDTMRTMGYTFVDPKGFALRSNPKETSVSNGRALERPVRRTGPP
jgi:hypothetical protein